MLATLRALWATSANHFISASASVCRGRHDATKCDLASADFGRLWPLARISTSGLPDLPEQWREGRKLQCRLYVLGVIPIGVRDLYFERLSRTPVGS
jgi:hypothetical protein